VNALRSLQASPPVHRLITGLRHAGDPVHRAELGNLTAVSVP